MLIVVYGPPGSGKTYIAGTLYELKCKTKHLDFEMCAETLDLLPDPNREIVPCRTFEEFKTVYENKVSPLKNSAVVFDSITEWQEILMRKISGRTDIFSTGVPSISQNNQLSVMMKDIIRDLKKWAIENNNIVILLAGEVVMEKRDIVTPDMRGKMGQWIVSAVNACVRLDHDESGGRILHLKDHENETGQRCLAKTRCNDEELIEDPTMKKLLTLIMRKKGKSS